MRMLFTADGDRPHIYPLVPLAWAFRAAGHEVRMASIPSVEDVIVHTGLPAVLLGTGPRQPAADRDDLIATIYGQDSWPAGFAADPSVLDDDQLALLHRLGRLMVAVSGGLADDLVAFAKDWRPDLVVYDASTYVGELVARVLGVPGVRHNFGSDTYPRLELAAPTGEPLPEYVRLFERFGVPASTSAAMIVEPTPPSMRWLQEEPRLDMRYIPYNGPGAVPEWLPEWLRSTEGSSRVCVTWGHTAAKWLGERAADPFRQAIEVLVERGASVLVLTGDEQIAQLGPLPERVRAALVPLQLVVGQCDLLVHQGGDGTTLTGASYGVPQLAITRKPDAETPAARIAATGIGLHLYYQHLRDDPASKDVIGAAVDKLLADAAYLDVATRLRQEIQRQPAPAEIVPQLVELARQGSDPHAD